MQSRSSDDGTWPTVSTKVWTGRLDQAILGVAVTGFAASSSSFSGFLGVLTGTSQQLAISRLPLAPLFLDGEGSGNFKIPLYAVLQDEHTNVVYGHLHGQLVLIGKKVDSTDTVVSDESNAARTGDLIDLN